MGPPPSAHRAGGVLRPGQPEFCFDEREYEVRLARTPAELEAAQRLRFEVFNRELGEGLAESEATGRDADPFDAHCDHLLLIHRAGAVRAGSASVESIGTPIEELASGTESVPRVVGTYRLATLSMAAQGVGLYCDQEYDLDRAPRAILEQGTELGRACIAREHRRGHALFALFRGLARYAVDSGQRYLYGCCSLTGTDPLDGSLARAWLAAHGKVHTEFYVPARERYRMEPVDVTPEAVAAFKLPQLFGTYLRYGAMVCSEPAVDRDFGTIDFLVMFDLEMLDVRVRRLFLEG
ncbi:hypothetical protein Pla163_05500 [Planctomycetes bacterium Pla163]|uniref:Hemolysin n=1 Tax=Rohdeia mirabilis TaxID=2528008 RepID=A0A518CW42_9BACT|nr:hypothetical protein Pla163_05500 [Planctomycetes bacterium Pla163]